MNEELEEAITKVGYIISVSQSMHPADTPQRKIGLMVGHAKDALAKLEKLKEEKIDGKEQI